MALLRCVLSAKPLLDTDAILMALRRVSGVACGERGQCISSSDCLPGKGCGRPFVPRIYFVGNISRVALLQLQKRVALVTAYSSEKEWCGYWEVCRGNQLSRYGFLVQQPENLWERLLCHLASATLGTDLSRPRMQTGPEGVKPKVVDGLDTALKLFAPQLPPSLSVLEGYLTSVSELPPTTLFKGCLALTLSDGCARRMRLLFEYGLHFTELLTGSCSVAQCACL